VFNLFCRGNIPNEKGGQIAKRKPALEAERNHHGLPCKRPQVRSRCTGMGLEEEILALKHLLKKFVQSWSLDNACI
jgi:hypothetical protein